MWECKTVEAYPETIGHRRDVLYRDYPEVYDRFASFPYANAGHR